jgi:hypothetical protein
MDYYFICKNSCLYTVDIQDSNLTQEFNGKKMDFFFLNKQVNILSVGPFNPFYL